MLSLSNHVITKSNSITASDIYIDGNRLGEINGAVLRDRKIMASDGILVVIANIDMKKKQLLIHLQQQQIFLHYMLRFFLLIMQLRHL